MSSTMKFDEYDKLSRSYTVKYMYVVIVLIATVQTVIKIEYTVKGTDVQNFC